MNKIDKKILFLLADLNGVIISDYTNNLIFTELRDEFKKLGYHLYFNYKPHYTYEAIVVINNLIFDSLAASVKKGNVFCLMQEPGDRLIHRFMYDNLSQYDLVFSSVKSAPNVHKTHPYLGWLFNKSIADLKKWTPPSKTKLLSCVMSNAKTLLGHSKRLLFLQKLKKKTNFDHFGGGFQTVENKEDALLNYNYSIAIENSSKDYYFTEKINDCFLCYTVPLYYGCTNIDKFFPPQSYIKINPNDVKGATRIINQELSKDDYQKRFSYLQEAREIVLKKYNLRHLSKNEIIPIIEKNKNQPFIRCNLIKTRPKFLWRLLFRLREIFIAVRHNLTKTRPKILWQLLFRLREALTSLR